MYVLSYQKYFTVLLMISWLTTLSTSEYEECHSSGSDRICIVESNSYVQSENWWLGYGVPQGSILSTLLLILYVHDVGLSLHQGWPIQYADDATLCFNANSNRELEMVTFIELNFASNSIQTSSISEQIIINQISYGLVYDRLSQIVIQQSCLMILNLEKSTRQNSLVYTWIKDQHRVVTSTAFDQNCHKEQWFWDNSLNIAQLMCWLPTAYYGIIYPHPYYRVTHTKEVYQNVHPSNFN